MGLIIVPTLSLPNPLPLIIWDQEFAIKVLFLYGFISYYSNYYLDNNFDVNLHEE